MSEEFLEIPLGRRVRAIWELSVPGVRRFGGRHEYDGEVQDLSPTGVRSGLACLGGPRAQDPCDEVRLSAAEAGLAVALGELSLHRSNPLIHTGNLDLSCYERSYAPSADRADARLRHLSSWPVAVEASLDALTDVPIPIAQATLSSTRALQHQIRPSDGEIGTRARKALDQLVARIEEAATHGRSDFSIGRRGVERLLGASEGIDLNIVDLEQRMVAERRRLQAMLEDACAQLAPGKSIKSTVQSLLHDYPEPSKFLETVSSIAREVSDFVNSGGFMPPVGGEVGVEFSPESRRWSIAMLSWSAPGEPDAPSKYLISPPGNDWPMRDQEEWMAFFSSTMLPVITAHEVSPGHHAHGMAVRSRSSVIAQSILSGSFTEGWAHYAEELMHEVGFRIEDPRYQIGVCLEGLIRVARFLCALGMHSGDMSAKDAEEEFRATTFLEGRAARSEVTRCLLDPGCGRYAWGKMELRNAREECRRRWGDGFTLINFHKEVLDMGAPPLVMLRRVVKQQFAG